MGDVKGLAAARVDKTRDCRYWTPLEALEELVREIKCGDMSEPDMLYIIIRLPDDDDPEMCDYFTRAAGVTNLEAVGLAAKLMLKADRSARGEDG